jgi:drug/metabolite transporter (DMT)-like permease
VRLDGRAWWRLGAIALFGAGVAPTLLAWGLQRTGAATGSMLLNLEAVFTAVLARALLGEQLGRRVAWALALMAAGGVVLAAGAASGGRADLLGITAIAGATLAWAFDNVLSRALAEHEVLAVVARKGLLGAVVTGGLAASLEPAPRPGAALVLLACGATGYGASLALYLLAQRRIGAARTGSIFALAPFLGAGAAWAAGGPVPGASALPAALLFAIGVALHVTERHGHTHAHPALEHEHPHRHDDGHHTHVHDPPVVGEHTHPHAHDALVHTHEHAPDVHHDHRHP